MHPFFDDSEKSNQFICSNIIDEMYITPISNMAIVHFKRLGSRHIHKEIPIS